MHDIDEKIDLAQRTKEFALRVVRLFCALPKNTQAQVIGKQVLRSGTSVGANYREARRARSKAEFLAKRATASKNWMKQFTGSNFSPKAVSSPRANSGRYKMKPNSSSLSS